MHMKAVVHGTVKSDSVLLSHPAHGQDAGYPSRIEPHSAVFRHISPHVCCFHPRVASDSEGDIFYEFVQVAHRCRIYRLWIDCLVKSTVWVLQVS